MRKFGTDLVLSFFLYEKIGKWFIITLLYNTAKATSQPIPSNDLSAFEPGGYKKMSSILPDQ